MKDFLLHNQDNEGDISFLLAVMKRLRTPGTGCPWDLEQTPSTLVRHTLEEAYEVAEAVERNDMKSLRDELGDLLLQVVFYAQIAQEKGIFDFSDVVRSISRKMIRRHPNIFGDEKTETAQDQTVLWEKIKESERRQKREGPKAHSILDGVTSTLPALMRAKKLQDRAARVGFDWEKPFLVLEKVLEEIEELRVEMEMKASRDRLEDEMGDILFACANLARKLDIDPESALRRANTKFERRFHHIENMIGARNGSLHETSLEEMESLWEDAKRLENNVASPSPVSRETKDRNKGNE